MLKMVPNGIVWIIWHDSGRSCLLCMFMLYFCVSITISNIIQCIELWILVLLLLNSSALELIQTNISSLFEVFVGIFI